MSFTSPAAQQRFPLKHPAAVFYSQCFAEAGGTRVHSSTLLISALLSMDFLNSWYHSLYVSRCLFYQWQVRKTALRELQKSEISVLFFIMGSHVTSSLKLFTNRHTKRGWGFLEGFFLLPSEDFPIASLLVCILLFSSLDLFTASLPPFSWMPLSVCSWSNGIQPSCHPSLSPQLLPEHSVETDINTTPHPPAFVLFSQKNPTMLYFSACKTGFPFLESPWQPSPMPAPGWIHLIWMLVTRSTRSIASRDSLQ